MIDDFGMMDYFWFWLLHSKCYFLWYEEKNGSRQQGFDLYIILIVLIVCLQIL